MENSTELPRLFRAMIWVRDPNHPGRRVTVLAKDLSEAKQKLEEEFGEGNVFDLHNEEDAGRPR
jgi:hypothetical protein